MRCTRPLKAYRGAVRGESGKRPLVFSSRGAEIARGLPGLDLLEVPCGRCPGCLLERSRQWAVRCMHEVQLHEENCYITLTYAPEHLPPMGSLDKGAFPLFMKRLRQMRFRDWEAAGSVGRPPVVRFFMGGEYGEENHRPHYHALLFGHDFHDKVFLQMRGEHRVFRSATLERLWPFGISEIGSATFESAGYVARYLLKRERGEDADRRYERVDPRTGEVRYVEREFALMSRKPGLGRRWLERYASEVFPRDAVVARGEQCKPPRYYFDALSVAHPGMASEVRRARIQQHSGEDDSPERLAVIEEVVVAKSGLHPRAL